MNDDDFVVDVDTTRDYTAAGYVGSIQLCRTILYLFRFLEHLNTPRKLYYASFISFCIFYCNVLYVKASLECLLPCQVLPSLVINSDSIVITAL